MITLKGKLIVVKDKEWVGNYTKFAKRECVLRLIEYRPEEILIEFQQDDCSLLDGYSVGDVVSIGIILKGRSWTNKSQEVRYFNTLQGWHIEPSDQ